MEESIPTKCLYKGCEDEARFHYGVKSLLRTKYSSIDLCGEHAYLMKRMNDTYGSAGLIKFSLECGIFEDEDDVRSLQSWIDTATSKSFYDI